MDVGQAYASGIQTWDMDALPGGSADVMYAYLESAYNGGGCFMVHDPTMEWPTTSLRRLMRAGGRATPVRFVIVRYCTRAVPGSILAPPPTARQARLIPTERESGGGAGWTSEATRGTCWPLDSGVVNNSWHW
ncbi:hypothetical protein B0E47_11720 [Rhodanobacter sp. B05]|jgi:hypothetical protein|nr:hypothetical protein B0E47_11720 [Rhodanobacter sp. B05]